MIVLIDADSLCYANAFAVEKDGELVPNAETFLYARLDKAINQIIRHTKADDYKVFLTAGSGYRGDVCTDYKANRVNMKRPILLAEAKEFLEVVHNAIVSDYYEADDWVCIEQEWCRENGIPSIIAHIDKDIDQMSGHHYNWAVGKKKWNTYYVSEIEGWRNLYIQALVGDKADNIMQWKDPETGTWKKDYGLGQKGAEKLLENITSKEEMYLTVLDAYTNMTKKSDGTTPDELDLRRNLDMLYLLRREDEFFGDIQKATV